MNAVLGFRAPRTVRVVRVAPLLCAETAPFMTLVLPSS
jgi:hypothetical protein